MNKKWVAAWGNAMSITEHRPETYAKDLTVRYPIYIPFKSEKMRVTLDNFCGLEEVTVTRATVLYNEKFYDLSFDGNESVKLQAGKNVVSDELVIDIKACDEVEVSLYFEGFTSTRSSVVAIGPLSKGIFAVGDQTHTEDISIYVKRPTDVVYFLSDVSVYTEENNRAVVCFGDSITAQDWPDYVKLYLRDAGIYNTSIIRKATSGSRILGEYTDIIYESYGIMGNKRFDHEVPVDGAEMVIIQHGINDIIHPVGESINPFRPMSNMPTLKNLTDGMEWYIERARAYGLKVYGGTLLPIEGWRTYAGFREEIKNEFNDWIRTTNLLDGCIDFDKAVRDEKNPKAFGEGLDSGDHLHPSKAGYKAMANECMKVFVD